MTRIVRPKARVVRRRTEFGERFDLASNGGGAIDFLEKAYTLDRNPWEDRFGFSYDPDKVTFTDLRKMMLDPQVKAAAKLKVLARLSSGWHIEAASDTAADEERAEFIRDQLKSMRGADAVFVEQSIAGALRMGLSVHETVLHQIDGGKWRGRVGLTAIKPKRPDFIKPIVDDFGNLTELRQKPKGSISGDTSTWTKLDPQYFLIWAYDHEGDFKGQSDLRAAHKWYKAKDFISRFWNIFLERYACPIPKATYPKNASEEDRDAIFEALKSLHTHGVMMTPEGWVIELLETVKRSGGDYEAAIKYCDRMIARAQLLPTLLMDEGESGSYSLGKEHANAFVWVLDAIGSAWAEEVANEQLIRRLIDWNFGPGPGGYPSLVWGEYSNEDLDKLAERMIGLVNVGAIDRREPFIRERLGLPEASSDLEPDPRDVKPAPATAPASGGTEPAANLAALDHEPKTLPPLVHAGKADFAAYETRLDALQDDAIATLSAAADGMLSALKVKIRRQRIVEKRDLAAVDKLTLTGVGEMRDALALLLGHGVHQGFADAKAEVARGLSLVGNEKLPDLGETTGINFSWGVEAPSLPGVILHNPSPESVQLATPPAGAEFASPEVIAAWKGKVPIQKLLLKEYEREAFTIAGAFRDEILTDAKQIIARGLRRGATNAQIEQELNTLFKPYLTVGGAIDPAVANPFRIENIVRTNLAEAYSTGRMNLMKHPDVGDFVVAYEYSAVMDSRTSQICETLHGVVVAADSPRVQEINPPNHYQCRGALIAVVRGEAFQVTSPFPSVEPQAGFRLCACCGGH